MGGGDFIFRRGPCRKTVAEKEGIKDVFGLRVAFVVVVSVSH